MRIDLLNKAQLSVINKSNFRYPLAIAEKDYFLAVVLQIIYSSKLKDQLVFKGGTAIHHLYLNLLRFSEDLDFASAKPVTFDDIRDVLEQYDFLEIKKGSPSDFSLKIDRLKFVGPLGHPNSIKLDIDLTQEVILPVQKLDYRNVYELPVQVLGMDLREICAEKLRAINERARYRDFYDLTMALRRNAVDPIEIVDILKKKELRKPLSKYSILDNLRIAEEAKNSGSENLYYREELSKEEIEKHLGRVLSVFDV
jgi:predicted nucleotidyltransferase component of viral defense system